MSIFKTKFDYVLFNYLKQSKRSPDQTFTPFKQKYIDYRLYQIKR